MADVLIARVSYDVLITRVLITRVDYIERWDYRESFFPMFYYDMAFMTPRRK